MRDVIGKELSVAVQLLSKDGYAVSVTETLSDKQKEWDNKLVVRQRITDNTVQLTVSNFKLKI